VFGVKLHQVDREWFIRRSSSNRRFGRSRRDGRIVTYIDRRGIGRMIEPLFVVVVVWKMLREMKGWRFASTIGQHWLVSFIVVGHTATTPIQILDSTKNHEVAISMSIIMMMMMMMGEWWSIRTGRRCCIPIRCMIQHSVAIVVQVGARRRRRRRRMTAKEWLKRSHWSMSIHNRR
jgi:hypothetical protein